jgi:hypothetical protein
MNICNFYLKSTLPTNHYPIFFGPITIRVRCALLSPASGFSVSLIPLFQHSNGERSELTGPGSGGRPVSPKLRRDKQSPPTRSIGVGLIPAREEPTVAVAPAVESLNLA